MIQRIQTLYLFLATIAIAMLFFFPLAEIVDSANHLYAFKVASIEPVGKIANFKEIPNLPVLIAVVLTILIGLVTIFYFKDRKVQIKLSYLNIILLIVLTVLIFVLSRVSLNDTSLKVAYLLPVTFPPISIILIFLAIRSIKKDEELVRSVDRIR